MFLPAIFAAVGSAASAATSAVGLSTAAGATATAATTSSWLGTAFKVGGAILSGISGYSSANYQAQVASMNADIARQAAVRERQATQQRVEIQGMKTKAVIGEQLAAQGASGLNVLGRSSQDVRAGTGMLGQFDAENIQYAGDQKAWGLTAQATNFDNQADGYRARATGEALGAGLKVGQSLVGGFNSYSDKWYRFNRPRSGIGATERAPSPFTLY